MIQQGHSGNAHLSPYRLNVLHPTVITAETNHPEPAGELAKAGQLFLDQITGHGDSR